MINLKTFKIIKDLYLILLKSLPFIEIQPLGKIIFLLIFHDNNLYCKDLYEGKHYFLTMLVFRTIFDISFSS